MHFLKTVSFFSAFLLCITACHGGDEWKIHDSSRPRPQVIKPGTVSTSEKPGLPPSDAIVLFDGTDLSEWRTGNNEPAKWPLKKNWMECKKKAGSIYSAKKFGDCQLHIEWSAPSPAKGKSQGRGNSGVYLMKKYELQVLDSYENETYADGQAAALYGQFPPLVNACRPPDEWQTYDIIFHRPRFDDRGLVVEPARMTVLHNGVLVQDNTELLGPTTHVINLPYQAHEDKLPIMLQDHTNPVRYRNIWVRELPEKQIKNTGRGINRDTLETNFLDKFVGTYNVTGQNTNLVIEKMDNQLVLKNFVQPNLPIYPLAGTNRGFFSKFMSTDVRFSMNKEGVVTKVNIIHGSRTVNAERVTERKANK